MKITRRPASIRLDTFEATEGLYSVSIAAVGHEIRVILEYQSTSMGPLITEKFLSLHDLYSVLYDAPEK